MPLSTAFQTRLANRALDHIGQEPLAVDITDTTADARRARRNIPDALAFVLRHHPWNAAKRRQRPAADAAPPVFGWARRFALPSDCLRVLSIDEREERNLPHAVEGRWLLTNEAAPLYLTYICDFTAAEDAAGPQDPMLFEAIALYLAWVMLPNTNDSQAQRAALFNEYKWVVAQARSIDGQEGAEPVLIADRYEAARFGAAEPYRRIS